MASDSVLYEAINKLVKANITLTEKALAQPTKAKECDMEITRNKSMILDYKFRLEHKLPTD